MKSTLASRLMLERITVPIAFDVDLDTPSLAAGNARFRPGRAAPATATGAVVCLAAYRRRRGRQ